MVIVYSVAVLIGEELHSFIPSMISIVVVLVLMYNYLGAFSFKRKRPA